MVKRKERQLFESIQYGVGVCFENDDKVITWHSFFFSTVALLPPEMDLTDKSLQKSWGKSKKLGYRNGKK
jgi:hypothetical protein